MVRVAAASRPTAMTARPMCGRSIRNFLVVGTNIFVSVVAKNRVNQVNADLFGKKTKNADKKPLLFVRGYKINSRRFEKLE